MVRQKLGGKERQMKKWYLRITTAKGTFDFPCKGFKTKREAEEQALLAKHEPQNISVVVVKIEA